MKMNWFEKLGVNSPIHTIELRKAARHLLKLGGTVSDGRVLEIGCGRGLGVELIFDLFSPSYVEAFEFDPDQIRLAKKNKRGRWFKSKLLMKMNLGKYNFGIMPRQPRLDAPGTLQSLCQFREIG